jgi:hypothetical protein
VLVIEGVREGVSVLVGVFVFVGVNVKDGVHEGVKVAVGVNVREGVSVAVGVKVAVEVAVGVLLAVPVITSGVKLTVEVGTVPVGVVEGVQVEVIVGVSCKGLGASPTATKPRQ